MKKLLLVLLVLAFAGTTQASNLQADDFEGGFYSHWTGNTVPNGWETWNPSPPAGYISQTTGNPGSAVEMSVPSGLAGGGFAFMWNTTKPVIVDLDMTLSADVIDLMPTPAYDFAAMKITAFDMFGTNLGDKEVKIANVTSSWANYSMDWVAPVGTYQVEITLAVSTDNPLVPDVGAAYAFDNMVLTPEPMTIALLGLGGLFLRRRK